MTPAASAKNLEELAKYRVLAFQKGLTTTVCKEGEERGGEGRRGRREGIGGDKDILTTLVALAS